MKRIRLHELLDIQEGHILKDWLPGKYISTGGLSFSQPGERSHTNDGPEGKDYHVHEDCEAFIILQGKGILEINRQEYAIGAGDVIIVEPGEDHHIISSKNEPTVVVWCHAHSERNIKQR